jgi:hypothetical protein
LVIGAAAASLVAADVQQGEALPIRALTLTRLTRTRCARSSDRPGRHFFPGGFAKCSLTGKGTIFRSPRCGEVREHYPMTKTDQYRAKAEECRLMAAKVTTAIDQAAWLGLATDWLGLIPDPARTASERFDAMERHRGTHQQTSSLEH